MPQPDETESKAASAESRVASAEVKAMSTEATVTAADNLRMERASNSLPANFSIAARLRSFVHAGRGIRTMLVSQHNAWIHAAASVVVLAAGLVLGISRSDWYAIILSMVAVWMAEALNTAFEFLCDVASPEFHPLVEKAKDVAAGAVLLSAIGAVAVAILVFGPYLLQWLAV